VAAGLIHARPAALRGFAIGHAALSGRIEGDRSPLSGSVFSAFLSLVETDSEGFARFALTQLTQDGYDEPLVRQMLERVSVRVVVAHLRAMAQVSFDLEQLLRPLDVPLLLGKHEGCLLYTDEGIADAVAAFLGARNVSLPVTCCASLPCCSSSINSTLSRRSSTDCLTAPWSSKRNCPAKVPARARLGRSPTSRSDQRQTASFPNG
jgi:hypothetical protein